MRTPDGGSDRKRGVNSGRTSTRNESVSSALAEAKAILWVCLAPDMWAEKQNPEPWGSGLRVIADHELRRDAGGAGEGLGFLGFFVSLRLLLFPLAIVGCGLVLHPQ